MSASRNYGNLYFMGTWDADTYYPYDEENFNYTPLVQYNSALYAAQAPTTKGSNPATDTTGWTLVFTDAGGDPTSALLTGYVASAGTVAATDTILEAFEKIGGSLATTSGQIIVGSSGGVATPRTVTGSVAISNTGATTLTNASLNALGALTNAIAAGSAIQQTGANTFANVKLSGSGATAPTVNDDSGDGYIVGSIYFDTVTQFLYFCTDATLGAAVWTQVLTS